MLRTKSLAALLMGTALVSIPAFCQEGAPENRSEASVQFMGAYLRDSTKNDIRNTATDSGGVLAGYRYFFTKHHGAEVNYAYTRNTLSYDFGRGPIGTGVDQHEASGSYIFRYPMRRFTPYAQAGAGALVFEPRDNFIGDKQTRAAFIYGGGVDLNITKHLFARVGYRGLVFKSPTFGLDAFNKIDRVTHQAEPTAGLGWRF